ncbi:unnamed protein product [Hanseniaspora opuntiae]
MLHTSRLVPKASFVSLNIKRYAAVNILGYDLYKQWYLSRDKMSDVNILSRNTLIAKTWKTLSADEKQGWIQRAEAMTRNAFEQKKQIYESKQFSIFSRIFCFYNIPGIIQEMEKNSNVAAYNPIHEGKVKILNLFLDTISTGGNRVENIKRYVDLLNSFKNPDLVFEESLESKNIQNIFPENTLTEIHGIWAELLSEVQEITFRKFLQFTNDHESTRFLFLFMKFFQKLSDKVPDSSLFIRDIEKVMKHANSTASRFELFFFDQYPSIENPYEFMINFKSILKNCFLKYNSLSEKELEELDRKSLEHDRYPVIQQGVPIYKKNLAYQLFVKESFYKRHFDSMFQLDENISTTATSRQFKNYNFEESDEVEEDDVEINTGGDGEQKPKNLTMPLMAFVDLNKEWNNLSKDTKSSGYWRKMTQAFEEGAKMHTSPYEAHMRKLMAAVRLFDNPRQFKGYSPILLYAELNYPHFEKYVEISSTRNKGFSFSKNKTSSLSAPKKNLIKSFDSSVSSNDDMVSGGVFHNLYERLFENYYDCFELEKVFASWEVLSDEEKCRYYILCSTLRFLRGLHICSKMPIVKGKKLGTSDFTYVLNKHIDASYLKEIYPYKKMNDLSHQPEMWPRVYAERAAALKKFSAEALTIFDYLKNVDEKDTSSYRRVILQRRSVAKTVKTLFESSTAPKNDKLLTYEDYFHAKKDEFLKERGFDDIDQYINSFDNSMDLLRDSLNLLYSQVDNFEAHLGELVMENGFSSTLTDEIQSSIKFKDFNSPSKIYMKLLRFVNKQPKALIKAFIEESIIKGAPLTERDIFGDKETPNYVYKNSNSQKLYDYLCSISYISSLKTTNNCALSSPTEKNLAKFHYIDKMGPPHFFKNVLKKFPHEHIGTTLLRVEHNAYMYAYRAGSLQDDPHMKNKDPLAPARLDCSFLIEFREKMFEEQVSLYNKLKEENPSALIKFSEVLVSNKFVQDLLSSLEHKYEPDIVRIVPKHQKKLHNY